MSRLKSAAARKAILSFLLIALLVFAAACGGGGEQTDEGASSQGAGQPQGETRQVALGDADNGRKLFTGTCASCHGQDATGMPGLGKNLVTSEWVAEQSDDELVEFIKVGRRANDPLNTTGVDMPPKGGNPALSDDDIKDIVAYIREINETGQ